MAGEMADRSGRRTRESRIMTLDEKQGLTRSRAELFDDSDGNPMMTELQELKMDIRELSRTLDESLASWHRGFGVITTGQQGCSARMLHGTATRKSKLPIAEVSLGRIQGDPVVPVVHLQDRSILDKDKRKAEMFEDRRGASDGRAVPPQPPCQYHEERQERRWVSAAVSSCRGDHRSSVTEDYGGDPRDVEEITFRVEASIRAVAREKDAAVKALRAEQQKTCQLLDGLREAERVKRQWKTLTEASRVLRQRLGSTERIRSRQKELMAELRAAEADVAVMTTTTSRRI